MVGLKDIFAGGGFDEPEFHTAGLIRVGLPQGLKQPSIRYDRQWRPAFLFGGDFLDDGSIAGVYFLDRFGPCFKRVEESTFAQERSGAEALQAPLLGSQEGMKADDFIFGLNDDPPARNIDNSESFFGDRQSPRIAFDGVRSPSSKSGHFRVEILFSKVGIPKLAVLLT